MEHHHTFRKDPRTSTWLRNAGIRESRFCSYQNTIERLLICAMLSSRIIGLRFKLDISNLRIERRRHSTRINNRRYSRKSALTCGSSHMVAAPGSFPSSHCLTLFPRFDMGSFLILYYSNDPKTIVLYVCTWLGWYPSPSCSYRFLECTPYARSRPFFILGS